MLSLSFIRSLWIILLTTTAAFVMTSQEVSTTTAAFAMTSQEFSTTDAHVFERLTHSFDENLSRILWINRTTSGPPESGPDTRWTWRPERPSTVPDLTFPARLTHFYNPTTHAALSEMESTTTTTATTPITTLLPASDSSIQARLAFYNCSLDLDCGRLGSKCQELIPLRTTVQDLFNYLKTVSMKFTFA